VPQSEWKNRKANEGITFKGMSFGKLLNPVPDPNGGTLRGLDFIAEEALFKHGIGRKFTDIQEVDGNLVLYYENTPGENSQLAIHLFINCNPHAVDCQDRMVQFFNTPSMSILMGEPCCNDHKYARPSSEVELASRGLREHAGTQIRLLGLKEGNTNMTLVFTQYIANSKPAPLLTRRELLTKTPITVVDFEGAPAEDEALVKVIRGNNYDINIYRSKNTLRGALTTNVIADKLGPFTGIQDFSAMLKNAVLQECRKGCKVLDQSSGGGYYSIRIEDKER
jgi:hypothetical protein